VVEGAGEHACEYMTDGTVVILGTVGRNVGAAMTGGEVFIYDQDSTLQGKLNADSVSAVPVREHDGAEARLRLLVEEHRDKTGSAHARQLLQNWDAEVGRFWLVQPKRSAPVATPARVARKAPEVAAAATP
jgi:glutamate synthase domain-containing protein 3